MAFTEYEKARIKHFLSYPNWISLGATIALGIPAVTETSYIIDQVLSGLAKIAPESEESVRIDLRNCECIEAEMADTSRLKASKIGNLEMNPREFAMLTQKLTFWVRRLCDDLGIPPNAYSEIHIKGYAAGRNAYVQN